MDNQMQTENWNVKVGCYMWAASLYFCKILMKVVARCLLSSSVIK